MTDVTTDETTAPAGDDTPTFDDVTPDDIITRGKGLKLEAIEEGSEAHKAVEQFKELLEQYAAAEAEAERLKEERNQAIYRLKNEHNVSFGAMAELMGVTSSLVLYLHERAQGKTSKQIREESQRSAAAKAKFQKPSEGKSKRKMSPEEREFRRQQREALKQFLAEQAARSGESDENAEAEG